MDRSRGRFQLKTKYMVYQMNQNTVTDFLCQYFHKLNGYFYLVSTHTMGTAPATNPHKTKV